jgi:hypothetical protein
MANTVAYNNGSNPVGSIKKGVVSINIDNSLIMSGLTWRNGIEIINQYIIYSDTYTQGIDIQANAKPCAWSCAYNDTALLNLINSLPPLIGQPKYGTLATAIAWLEGQNKYFLVNQSYPEIVTSGCVLNVDAGMSGSYPNVGTTWYDVSGNQYNGTLTNGPTWISSGTSSSISFDGSDDYVTFGGVLPISNNKLSIETLYNMSQYQPQNQNRLLSKGDYYVLYFDGSNSLDFYTAQTTPASIGGYGGSFLNSWKHIITTYDGSNKYFYINGVLTKSGATTGNISAGEETLNIAAFRNDPKYTLNGRMSHMRMYDRALSQSEILQNYYKGKLVTSGLTLALDAGNLISYSGNGLTWYDMTPNGNNGTLTNGVTYSGGTTPSMVFDGADDYVNVPYNASKISFPENNATICVWFNSSPSGDNNGCLVTQRSVNGFQTYVYGNRFYADGGGVSNGVYSTTTIIPGTTYFGCAVYDKTNSLLKIYVNGNYESQYSYTGNIQDTYPIRLGNTGTFSDGPYPGNIFAAQVYNRALSASEISQNFNTYRRRYGI